MRQTELMLWKDRHLNLTGKQKKNFLKNFQSFLKKVVLTVLEDGKLNVQIFNKLKKKILQKKRKKRKKKKII